MSGAGGQADGAGKSASRRPTRYIVRMADVPAVSYDGQLPTMAATRPPRGTRLDRQPPAVVAYSAYLDRSHDDVLRRVSGGRKLYDYRYSFNGFTAELTDSQADALKQVSGVISVTKDELQHVNTSSTQDFLGLGDRDGLWERVGGPAHAGEDMIIGVIDSGPALLYCFTIRTCGSVFRLSTTWISHARPTSAANASGARYTAHSRSRPCCSSRSACRS
jgi:hypothetical protein